MERLLNSQPEVEKEQNVKARDASANFIIASVEGLGPRKIPLMLEEVRNETGIKYHTAKTVVASLVEDKEIKITWDNIAIRIPREDD